MSTDLKESALWLYDQGYVPTDVCDIFGISRSSLSRWQRNIGDYSTVVAPTNYLQGRPCRLDNAMTLDLLSLVEESPELFLDKIQEWLAIVHDAPISLSALHDNIRWFAAAERDDEQRAAWRAHMQANFVASQVVTVDESSKDDWTIFQRYGRSSSGHRATIDAPFVRGQQWSLVAALGVDGYIAAHAVPGSVDGGEFLDFILEEVVSLWCCNC
ncbi:hypothetical protein JAAARDRAFT_57538 [Jaapia argillacea MUCL 33604]|uniref:Tc1-like transposase DDE domain-containing protein n=1 Tax=Jaapia argillacea MUCL 33604 TaxID=933084 RepID=A0A067PUY7_9AGAM|nr:hypothetical protein JAAARDRAFT_57538 [Jaapia argillacea MUCL 33604]